MDVSLPQYTSTINVGPATGGSQQTAFTLPTLGVTTIRVISKTTLLLIVDNASSSKTVDTSQNGLWKVNTDGTGLTRLNMDKAGQLSYLNRSSQYPWSNISRDGSLYALDVSNSQGKIASYTLLFGSLSGGEPTVFASVSDGTELAIVGWTGSEPF